MSMYGFVMLQCRVCASTDLRQKWVDGVESFSIQAMGSGLLKMMSAKQLGGEELAFSYSIRAVSQRTGLSPHVIRVWEKRYSTLKPQRSATNRRMYCAGDVARLLLLRRALEAGHGIGNVARLPDAEIEALLAQDNPQLPTRRPEGAAEAGGRLATDWVDSAFKLVLAMDSVALERLLDEGAVALGHVRLLNDVVGPLVERIGESWRVGDLKVAHEHIASAVIRTYLGHMARPSVLHPGAPVVLVTTPAGQMHELGAALAAAAAAQHGWRVVFAGAAMPASEIAAAAIQNRARAVALSIVYPADDPSLGAELLRLRRVLPGEIPLMVGGRAAAGYRVELESIRAVCTPSLTDFLEALGRLRA